MSHSLGWTRGFTVREVGSSGSCGMLQRLVGPTQSRMDPRGSRGRPGSSGSANKAAGTSQSHSLLMGRFTL
jgi:hypothetical protein